MKTNDIYDAFIHKAEDIPIKDKRYPTNVETDFARDMLQKNLTEQPCFDISMEPSILGTIIVDKDDYIDYRFNEWNEEAKVEALAEAIAAERNEVAKAAMTSESQAVKDILANNVITVNSAEAQLPTFPQPGLFCPLNSWTEKQIARKQALHLQRQENYVTYIAMQQAARKWLETVFGRDSWVALIKIGTNFQPMLSARDILEHIESNTSNNEPIDIDVEI